MTKNDLKYGNVVELKNGDRFLYIGDKHNRTVDFLNLVRKDFDLFIHSYRYDLIYDNMALHHLDIMKVYKDYTLEELLWERKEGIPKLSDDEKAILRNVDKRYKWLARDRDGSLGIYENKPNKSSNIFWSEGHCKDFCFNCIFQFIKWEDEEPYLIEDLLNGN